MRGGLDRRHEGECKGGKEGEEKGALEVHGDLLLAHGR
jgi:hypothetical protein